MREDSTTSIHVADRAMADIYRSSLQAKYDSVASVIASNLGFGDDLTALTQARLLIVHDAADQAILNWASRRRIGSSPLCPNSNLQHLLDEYCAIADHL